MTHEEAKRKAVDSLFAAIAHMNDYQDDEIEGLLGEAIMFITEGAIQAIKHNFSSESNLRLRAKTIERREKKVQTLIRMKNEMLERDDWKNFKDEIEAITLGGMAIQRMNKIDFGEEGA